MKEKCRFLVALCCFVSFFEAARSSANLGLGYGLPGTTQTISGYDTELGTDAMCWRSQGSLIDTVNSVDFPNPLIQDFRLNGQIKLLDSCPIGNSVIASAPKDFTEGERLRTEQWRNYTVAIKLNTTSLTENGAIADRFFTSDKGPMIAVQIMACRIEVSGFCSPFKHEESNARLSAQNKTQRINQGDSHGGSHVHSGYKLIELPPANGPIYELVIEIPMIVNSPGLYFPIAAVQLFFKDIFSIDTRYDIANAMPPNQRLVNYQEPPTILSVPNNVRTFAYSAIGGVMSVIIFLLYQCIKYREHQILKLTQGHFIIVFLIASLGVTVSCFMLEPRNDVYCRFGGPVVFIFAQLLYAVTLCRLWRINAVISPLLVQTLRQRESDSMFRRLSVCFRPSKEEIQKKLRKTVTEQTMVFRIALVTLPQFIIQAFALVIAFPEKTIEFNDDKSVGRDCCLGHNSYGTLSGIIVFGILILTLLSLAHHTRSLPSLFNETRDIFDSTLVTLVIVLLGGGIKAVSSGATTSPAVDFLVDVGLALSCALNTTVRIVLPKLRKIWRGETVLVSKLMSDHKVAVMKDDLLYQTKRRKRSRQCGDEDDLGVTNSMADISSVGDSCCHNAISVNTHSEYMDFFSQEFPDSDSVAGFGLNKQSKRNRILLTQDKAPDRKLTLKLINMQSCLKDINERIMAGVVVPTQDWTSLRRLSTGLASTFNQEVSFAWETPLSDLERTSPGRDRKYSHDQSSLLVELNDGGETADSSELNYWHS